MTKGGRDSNIHRRTFRILSPCGVSATGGRGQIYLTGGGPLTFILISEQVLNLFLSSLPAKLLSAGKFGNRCFTKF